MGQHRSNIQEISYFWPILPPVPETYFDLFLTNFSVFGVRGPLGGLLLRNSRYHPNGNGCYSNFSEIKPASASAM